MSVQKVGDRIRSTAEEIRVLASRFAETARGALETSLMVGVERLIGNHGAWFMSLGDARQRALRKSVEETVAASAARIADKLRDPDLWFAPSVLLERREELVEPEPASHHLMLEDVGDQKRPVWAEEDIQLVSRTVGNLPEDRLDDHLNRVWICMTNGADPLDGVLTEFGLQPKVVPDVGGGHFGVQPQNAHELDPSGELSHLWKRYVGLFSAYVELLEKLKDAQAKDPDEEALRRWRADAGPST